MYRRAKSGKNAKNAGFFFLEATNFVVYLKRGEEEEKKKRRADEGVRKIEPGG